MTASLRAAGVEERLSFSSGLAEVGNILFGLP